MDAAVLIGIVLAGIGVGYAMSRASKLRKEFPELAEKKPPRMSKREKRLEQIRASEPEFVPPSIEDLVAAEIAEQKIDEIDGAEGLDPAVMLRVFRRDEPVAHGCPRESLRFSIAGDVDPSEATIDDVRLVCDSPAPPTTPEPEMSARSDDSSDPGGSPPEIQNGGNESDE